MKIWTICRMPNVVDADVVGLSGSGEYDVRVQRVKGELVIVSETEPVTKRRCSQRTWVIP